MQILTYLKAILPKAFLSVHQETLSLSFSKRKSRMSEVTDDGDNGYQQSAGNFGIDFKYLDKNGKQHETENIGHRIC